MLTNPRIPVGIVSILTCSGEFLTVASPRTVGNC